LQIEQKTIIYTPGNVAEGHPEIIPLPLHFEEVKEDVNKRCAPEETEQYVESFDKGPTVRIQLGRSNIDLRQQFPIEPGERQAHADALKDHLIEVEKGDPVVGLLIPAYRLP